VKFITKQIVEIEYNMGSIRFLKCRECGAEYSPIFKYICEECFGPLDVIYDVPPDISRDTFSSRQDKTYWRYFELLPIADKSNIVSLNAGLTPLQNASSLLGGPAPLEL